MPPPTAALLLLSAQAVRERAQRLLELGLGGRLGPECAEQVEIEVKYQGYIERQGAMVERVRRLEERHIPEDFDYDAMVGLRHEAREKLNLLRPTTLGQAGRIDGVTPADISILMVYLERARAR